jgi:hypothetical protein
MLNAVMLVGRLIGGTTVVVQGERTTGGMLRSSVWSAVGPGRC